MLLPEQRRSNNAHTCFNWFEPGDTARGEGEAASIRQMVAKCVADHGLNPQRVYITGLSAGAGAMTAVMLATYPDVFAGGAIIAGVPFGAASGVKEALAAMHQCRSLPAQTWGNLVREASPPARRGGSPADCDLARRRRPDGHPQQRAGERQAMGQYPWPGGIRRRRGPGGRRTPPGLARAGWHDPGRTLRRTRPGARHAPSRPTPPATMASARPCPMCWTPPSPPPGISPNPGGCSAR